MANNMLSMGIARKDFADVALLAANNDGLAAEYGWLFNKKKSTQSYEKVEALNNLGPATPWSPAYPAAQNMNVDYPLTITPTLVGQLFEVNYQGRYTDQYGKVKQVISLMPENVLVRKAIDAADFFGNAFAGTTSADGQYLASASHTSASGQTYSTLDATSRAISLGALKALSVIQTNQKYPGGVRVRFAGARKLVVPNELMLDAEQILSSVQIPGSADNDKNVLHGKIELATMSYLGDYSTTMYFLAPSDPSNSGMWWIDQIDMHTTVTSDKADTASYMIQSSYALGALNVYGFAFNAGGS